MAIGRWCCLTAPSVTASTTRCWWSGREAVASASLPMLSVWCRTMLQPSSALRCGTRALQLINGKRILSVPVVTPCSSTSAISAWRRTMSASAPIMNSVNAYCPVWSSLGTTVFRLWPFRSTPITVHSATMSAVSLPPPAASVPPRSSSSSSTKLTVRASASSWTLSIAMP